MKTKKLVSLFLAVAMIFAVLTVSVSAAQPIVESGSETDINENLEYCTGLGYLKFTNSNRKLEVWTEAINTSGTTMTFRIQAQGVINYSDNTQDFDSNLTISTVEPQTNTDDGTAISYQSILGNSNKTIISCTGEYYIADTRANLLWEAYITETQTLGING